MNLKHIRIAVNGENINYKYAPGQPIRPGADVWRAMSRCLTFLERETVGPPIPRIVCLCGSTRFWREFQRQALNETMAGRIVLSIGAATGTDDEHFGNLPPEEYARVKQELDELHKRKIDLCDEILVLNVDGYVGDSTKSEIRYAAKTRKPIRWLEPDKAWNPTAEGSVA